MQALYLKKLKLAIYVETNAKLFLNTPWKIEPQLEAFCECGANLISFITIISATEKFKWYGVRTKIFSKIKIQVQKNLLILLLN